MQLDLTGRSFRLERQHLLRRKEVDHGETQFEANELQDCVGCGQDFVKPEGFEVSSVGGGFRAVADTSQVQAQVAFVPPPRPL